MGAPNTLVIESWFSAVSVPLTQPSPQGEGEPSPASLCRPQCQIAVRTQDSLSLGRGSGVRGTTVRERPGRSTENVEEPESVFICVHLWLICSAVFSLSRPG